VRNRTSHWEITAIANGVTVKLCNLATFIRKYNYEKMYIYNQISTAKKYKEDSTTIDGWKIAWFYNDPLESLEKLVIGNQLHKMKITCPIIKQEKTKNNYKNSILPELVGRVCYN